MDILIKNGRVIDPVNNKDEVADVLVKDGKIAKISKNIKENNAKIIDAKNKIISPGLIDMHSHLREPGREDEETILSGSMAAAKGGFTSLCAMPNTSPPCDNEGAVGFVISEANKGGYANVFPIGTITKGRAGLELSEMGELKRSGAIALSDDGNSLGNAELMRRALEYSSMLDMLIISHCEDKNLSNEGVMNEGYISTLLGLRGIPNISESMIAERDLRLAEFVNTKIHIAHVSTKESVELIREAKRRGVKVTCETCPHYFTLTDEACIGYDTNAKVNPPLRTKEDIEAIKKGLLDGTIDVIATDHAPHTEDEKDVEYDQAPFGIIGLETALSLSLMELADKGVLSLMELIRKLSLNPSNILKLGRAKLEEGAVADIIVFDLDSKWVLKKESIVSKSKNTPFLNKELKGRVLHTIVSGRVVLDNGKIVEKS